MPRERVIGSTTALAYSSNNGGTITHNAEADYTAGADQALEQADRDGWTVVSVKNDWETVFAPGARSVRPDPPS